MNASSKREPRQVGRLAGLASAAAWIFAAVLLVGVALLWQAAANFDHAIVNVLTFLLLILAWGSLVVSLQLSGRPRWMWRSFFLGPVLACAVLFALYRVERVDGDLSPKFVSRWKAADELPQASVANETLSAELWQPRASDSTQFLGPTRNAIYSEIELDSDWNAHPPKVLWKVPIGDGWSSFAIQGDVAVTMEQRNEQEWITCYNVLNGELLWGYAIDSKHTNPMGGTGPRSTPLLADNRVYACSAVSQLVCLDIANGQELWTQDLLKLAGVTQSEFEMRVAWGRSASPLIYKEQIIVPMGGANACSLIGFDAITGQERWRAGQEEISYASPSLATIHDREQLLYITEQHLRAFDPQSQAELWSVPWPGSSHGSASVSQPLVFDGNRILMSKGYGEGCQVIEVELTQEGENADPDASQTSTKQWSVDVKWKNATSLRTKFTTAVIRDGYAYGLSDGILECIALADGERQWKKGRYRQGQVLLVGSHLLITSESGEIVLVAATPERFHELAKLDVIGDVTWNVPALSGNRLLMRNSDEAACVILPTVELPKSEPLE